MTDIRWVTTREDPRSAVAAFLADGGGELWHMFEGVGDDADHQTSRLALSWFKTAVAAMAAGLGGPPDLTPTRKQGVIAPPRLIEGTWSRLAIWRRADATYYVCFAGRPGKSTYVQLLRDAERTAP